VNIGWLQDEPRAARMDVKGEKACRAASPCLYGRTEALHTDSNGHTPLAGFSYRNEISEFWTKFMHFAI
jgi:hypothetical protein